MSSTQNTDQGTDFTAEDLREVTSEAVASAGRADSCLARLLEFAREQAQAGECEAFFSGVKFSEDADFWYLKSGERKAVLAGLAARGFDFEAEPGKGPTGFSW